MFLLIRCSWSGLSSSLLHILSNFLDFRSLFLFYPLVWVGLGWHFKFVLPTLITSPTVLTRSRTHLRTASSQLFKMTQNIRWVLYTLHMVQPLLKDSIHQNNGIHKLTGFGALSAPLSATRFAQLTHWSSHYLVSICLAVSNILILAGVFRFASQDGTSVG